MHFFQFTTLQRTVGGFFLLTCAIVIVLVGIAARGQKWFESYAPYAASFEAGGGLKVGTAVTVKGLEAGSVSSLGLGPGGKVEVGIRVLRRYEGRINRGARILLVQPLIGSSSLDITPGPDGAPPLPPGAEIPAQAEDRMDLTRLVADTNQLVNSTSLLISHATRLAKNLEDPRGDLARTLANLNAATAKLAEALDSKQGTAGLLLQDRQLYDSLTAATRHLEAVLKGLEASTPELQESITGARKNLDEADKVIRALQKNFLIRGGIEAELNRDSYLHSEGRAPL